METTLPTRSKAWKHYKKKLEFNEFVYLAYDKFDIFCDKILEIGDFIPCKDGVPLEKPDIDKYSIDETLYKHGAIAFGEANREYQQALDRVIFKGFEIVNIRKGETWIRHTSQGINIHFYDNGIIEFNDIKIKSISDLRNKVELTDKKYNELNLK